MEFVMILVVASVLGSIAMQRFITLSENAEIVEEDSIIATLRANITNHYLEQVASGKDAQHFQNPFENLTNTPGGYNRRRNFPPYGVKEDDMLWVYVPLGTTPSQADGKTIFPKGEIWHQRRDHTTIKWDYDPNSGIVSPKTVVQKSDLKLLLEARQRQFRQPTEEDIRLGRQTLDFLTPTEDQARRN